MPGWTAQTAQSNVWIFAQYLASSDDDFWVIFEGLFIYVIYVSTIRYSVLRFSNVQFIYKSYPINKHQSVETDLMIFHQ